MLLILLLRKVWATSVAPRPTFPLVGHPWVSVISFRSDKDIEIRFIGKTADNPESDVHVIFVCV